MSGLGISHGGSLLEQRQSLLEATGLQQLFGLRNLICIPTFFFKFENGLGSYQRLTCIKR